MDCICCVTLFVLMVQTSSANPLVPANKLSLATWGSYYQRDHMGPGTYVFGYDLEDPVTGNVQFRQEERYPNGTVAGTYGYVDADGKPHVVTYVADDNGYRAKKEVEEGPTKCCGDAATPSGSSARRRRGAPAGPADEDVAADEESPSPAPSRRESDARRSKGGDANERRSERFETKEKSRRAMAFPLSLATGRA